MNTLLLLFIEPINFHNTLQFNTEYNYLSIQSPFNIKNPKTTQDKDNTIGHNTKKRKDTYFTKHYTKQRKHTYFTKHYTKQRKHTYLTKHYTNECFLKILTHFLFPRNTSVSKRSISFSWIRDQKAMNLLPWTWTYCGAFSHCCKRVITAWPRQKPWPATDQTRKLREIVSIKSTESHLSHFLQSSNRYVCLGGH